MTTAYPLALPARVPERVGGVDVNSITCCDALTLLARLPDNSVDCIVTDPPYGIGYASAWQTHSDGSPRQTNGTFGEDKLQTDWLIDIFRVLKTGGALYLCTRWDVCHLWKQAIEQSGLNVVQRIIWDKCHWTMGDLRYYGTQVEDILFCVKGVHNLRWDKRAGNIWKYPTGKPMANTDGWYDHPTQKPIKLMKRAISLSSDIGDLILDPFLGSGTTAVAARNLGRRYIGCDISSEYCQIARTRLAQPFTPLLFELTG